MLIAGTGSGVIPWAMRQALLYSSNAAAQAEGWDEATDAKR
jgi:hypothetical protein